jgi:putative sterol carrier protein
MMNADLYTFSQQNGVFFFIVSNSEGKKQEFLVDMRKTGSFYLGKSVPGQKVKPDVTISVNDKDMVALSTGKLNPQMAFMKGKLKVKGNLMLGLRCQSTLQSEIQKMSRL